MQKEWTEQNWEHQNNDRQLLGQTTLENISTEGQTTLENISTKGEIMSNNVSEHQYRNIISPSVLMFSSIV
jgi:hypothetical protein